MAVFAGDAHRFYRRLRQRYPSGAIGGVKELDHLRQIRQFYDAMDAGDRRLLHAWLKKERQGIGMIPLALTSIIWFSFMFGKQIEKTVTDGWPFGWIGLLGIWVTVVLTAVYVHFREQAWTELHISLIEAAAEEEKATDGCQPDTRRDGHCLAEHGEPPRGESAVDQAL